MDISFHFILTIPQKIFISGKMGTPDVVENPWRKTINWLNVFEVRTRTYSFKTIDCVYFQLSQ